MEEHRLRVFENRVPRKIFGPKRDEVTGERRELRNEEFLICKKPMNFVCIKFLHQSDRVKKEGLLYQCNYCSLDNIVTKLRG